MISLASGGKKKKKKKKKNAKGFDLVMPCLPTLEVGALPIELIWLVESGVFRHLFIYLPLKE